MIPKPITFVHTADIHFGMENYGRIDPATGIHTRLLDFDRALNVCIDVAIDRNVDFFLFAGDAYKTAHPTQTQQRLLCQCFMRLYRAGIPIVMVVGNHDNPLSFGKAHAVDIFGQLPLDGFYVMGKPTMFTLQTKSGSVQIVGMPWPTRNTIAISEKHLYQSPQEITQYISQAVAHIIKQFAQQLDATIPAVLTGHLTVSSGIFSGSEKRAVYGTDPILLPSELAIAPFDYVGLGHLHRYQDLNSGGYPSLVYSGSIERIDFGERKEEKGFCLVTIHQKNKTTHEFIRVPTRPFIQLEVKLKAGKPHTEQLLDQLARHEIDGAVIKILYHVPEGEPDNVDIKRVQSACSSAMHLVGIIPVRQIVTRERRLGLASVRMDARTLLERYFEAKPTTKSRMHDLTEKALALLDEQQAEER